MHRIYTEYGTKTIIEPTETTGIYSFVFISYMYWIWARNIWHYKWWNTFNGILSKSDFIVVGLKTWVSTSDEIGIIAKDLCRNCTENELRSCFTLTERSRAIPHLSATKKAWKNLTQSDENCLLAFDILLTCCDYRSKYNLHIIMKILVFARDLQPICAVFELETWLALSDGTWYLGSYISI